MKLLYTLVIALFMTTFVSVINTDGVRANTSSYAMSTVEQSNIYRAQCGIFIMPALPPIPKVKTIDDRIAKSRTLTENHLLEELEKQIAHSKAVKQLLEKEYRDYIKNCSKSTQ